jgi:hypothetical protein
MASPLVTEVWQALFWNVMFCAISDSTIKKIYGLRSYFSCPVLLGGLAFIWIEYCIIWMHNYEVCDALRHTNSDKPEGRRTWSDKYEFCCNSSDGRVDLNGQLLLLFSGCRSTRHEKCVELPLLHNSVVPH